MEITGIISAIVIGAVIGALGRLTVPGQQRMALWLTVLVGFLAALAGTAVAATVGLDSTAGVDWIELALQVGIAALGVRLATRDRVRQLH